MCGLGCDTCHRADYREGQAQHRKRIQEEQRSSCHNCKAANVAPATVPKAKIAASLRSIADALDNNTIDLETSIPKEFREKLIKGDQEHINNTFVVRIPTDSRDVGGILPLEVLDREVRAWWHGITSCKLPNQGNHLDILLEGIVIPL